MPQLNRHAANRRSIAKATLAIVLCATTSACTSLRISGLVTDERTGEPVGVCGITSGPNYARTDPIGHYTIAVKPEWNDAGDGARVRDADRAVRQPRHPPSDHRREAAGESRRCGSRVAPRGRHVAGAATVTQRSGAALLVAKSTERRP